MCMRVGVVPSCLWNKIDEPSHQSSTSLTYRPLSHSSPAGGLSTKSILYTFFHFSAFNTSLHLLLSVSPFAFLLWDCIINSGSGLSRRQMKQKVFSLSGRRVWFQTHRQASLPVFIRNSFWRCARTARPDEEEVLRCSARRPAKFRHRGCEYGIGAYAGITWWQIQITGRFFWNVAV